MNTLTVNILLAQGYLVVPTLLIVGWIRWAKWKGSRTPAAIFCLVSFVFASSSALLAFVLFVLAQIHHFGSHDPLVMGVFQYGIGLSLISVLFSIAGLWRPNELRWFAPACALGTLAFWLVNAASE